MPQFELFEIPNPCIGVCQTANSGYCIGCLRSRLERQHWYVMSDDEKHRVLGLLTRRRQKLNKLARQTKPMQLTIFQGIFVQGEFEQF